MKKTNTNLSCLGIHKKVVGGVIRFDLEVQRRGVWSVKQKQKLMDSLIHDWPVPAVYFVDKNDDSMWALDGQQRCRAITEFISGGYPLSDKIEDYFDEASGENIKIAGMKYDDLPQAVKTDFNSRNVLAYNIKGATSEQIAEMFVRLNGGTPMKKIELTRVHAGAETMSYVNDLSGHDFFTKKTALTDKARVHFTDHEAIMQCLAVMNGEQIGFSGKEIEEFAVSLKDDLKPEFRAEVDATADYLNDVFNEPMKYLKKSNIPMVFFIANKGRKAEIASEKMLEFFNGFFVNALAPDADYMQTLIKDSAKKAMVAKRIEIIESAFDKEFN